MVWACSSVRCRATGRWIASSAVGRPVPCARMSDWPLPVSTAMTSPALMLSKDSSSSRTASGLRPSTFPICAFASACSPCLMRSSKVSARSGVSDVALVPRAHRGLLSGLAETSGKTLSGLRLLVASPAERLKL